MNDNMDYLYLLTEDDNDDLFFQLCIEKVTHRDFKLIPVRLREGSIAQVRKHLPRLIQSIQQTGRVEGTFFAVAVDNDRAQIHPHHELPTDPGKVERLPKRERNKPCRYCELEQMFISSFGPERDSWPIQGAVGVPVQMLESWLLLICNPERYKHEADLPLFADKTATLAKKYFAPHPPKDQLKDLRELEKQRLKIDSTEDFCLECAALLEPEDLAKRSPSFAIFKKQIERWGKN